MFSVMQSPIRCLFIIKVTAIWVNGRQSSGFIHKPVLLFHNDRQNYYILCYCGNLFV